jgi:hypothetical protein
LDDVAIEDPFVKDYTNFKIKSATIPNSLGIWDPYKNFGEMF